MDPSEIEHRRFLVALRGYDRDEVERFLEEVASGQRELLQRLDAAEAASADAPADAFGAVGERVAGILRSAEEAAQGLTADRLRDAEEEAQRRIEAAEVVAAEKEHTAEALVADSQRVVDEAHAEAARIIREAEDTARARADAMVDEATRRVSELERVRAQLRSRVAYVIDDVAAALATLDDGERAGDDAGNDAPETIDITDAAQRATDQSEDRDTSANGGWAAAQ